MLREKTSVRDRNVIIAQNDDREAAREKLFGDFEEAKRVLSPSYQFRKMVDRNKRRARNAASEAGERAKAAAPMAGIIGLGAAIFFARKPIAKWISGLRKSKTNPPDGE